MPSGVRFAIDRAIKATTAKSATAAKKPSSLFGFGKKKKKTPKIPTKVVKIYPVRTTFPDPRTGQREIKYYRDSEGRRYEPVTWDEKSGMWITGGRVHMRRDDGVIFKIRRDGRYQMVIPKQPRRKKPRRR